MLVSGHVSHTWILDLGATFCVTPHREWFSHYEEDFGIVTFGDNHQSDIVGIGDITLVFSNGNRLVIEDVRHVPKLTCSLISCGRLDDLGYRVDFHNQSWRISKGNLIIGSGAKVGTLYTMYVSPKNSILSVTELPNVALWHGRLGHMSKKGMETLSHSGYLPSLCV